MTTDELQQETTELRAALVRLNTVNPPGNERLAIEHLERYLRSAGLRTEVLAADPARPTRVPDRAGERAGPTLCFLGHVDTVLANASEWTHDPWSAELADGYPWGRGGIGMEAPG